MSNYSSTIETEIQNFAGFRASNKTTLEECKRTAASYRLDKILMGRADRNSTETKISNFLRDNTPVKAAWDERALMVPFAALLPSTRVAGLSVQGGDTGSDLTQQTVNNDIIEPLRANSVLLKNSQVIPVPVGNTLLLPRAGFAGVAGSGETTSTSSTFGTFTQAELVGNLYSSSILVSRQLIEQSRYRQISDFIKLQLLKNAALLQDQIGLYGTGATGQDLGIFNVSNNTLPSIDPSKTSQAVSVSGSPTWANINEFSKNLDTANIGNNRKWLISPATRSNLAQTFVTGSTYPRFLLDGGLINELPYEVSTTLSVDDRALLLDPSQVVYALFGNSAVITVNPYTYADSNQVELSIGLISATTMLNYSAACPSSGSMANS